MFEDREITYKELRSDTQLNLSEDEYVMQVADNALALEIALNAKPSILKSNDCQKLHRIMGRKIDENAGIINGLRHLPFFDKKGKRNMADGSRLIQELKLLDKQTDTLMKRAGKDPEEKIKAVCTQAMRLFAIHPFNDANKRMVKLMLTNFMEKEFKLKVTQRPAWKEISRKIINQAVRGNNIGPFAREVCDLYGISYDPQKITEVELSAFRIYPDTGQQVYSMKEEIKRSTLRKGQQISYKEPIITRQELKLLGIESKGIFRKNPVCEDLLSSESSDSFLRKTKQYFERGKLSEEQAKELTKKAILIIDGAEEKSCDLATTKFLKTDMNDVRKAVRFYEKEDFKIERSINQYKKRSILIETDKIKLTGESTKTIRL